MELPTLSFTGMNEAFLSNRLFEGLTPEVLRSVDIQEMEYQPGDLIFDEAPSGSTLMLVGRGRVQISKTGRQGLQETLATIEKNDFFGEMAVIDHGPRSARAIALESALVGEVDHKTFTRLMNSAPDTLPLTFTRVVVQRLRYTNARYIEQLLQNERLTLLGTMVSSIVHDLKNPMSAILSSVDYLEKTAPTDSVRQLAEIIQSSALRIVEMSEELLGFARGKVNIRPRVTSALRLMELLDQEILNQVRETQVRLVIRITDADHLTLDEVRFTRCLANIVTNAKEALGDEGTITIHFREK